MLYAIYTYIDRICADRTRSERETGYAAEPRWEKSRRGPSLSSRVSALLYTARRLQDLLWHTPRRPEHSTLNFGVVNTELLLRLLERQLLQLTQKYFKSCTTIV